METKGQFEIISNILFTSFRFIWIPWYGSTTIINILLFQCGDWLYTSESGVYRRQILTYKDGPRAERVNSLFITYCHLSGFLWIKHRTRLGLEPSTSEFWATNRAIIIGSRPKITNHILWKIVHPRPLLLVFIMFFLIWICSIPYTHVLQECYHQNNGTPWNKR